MMKKLFFVLTALLIVSLVACASPAPAPTPAPAPAPAPAPTPAPAPAPAPAPKPVEKYRLTVSSTAITSSIYTQQVAMTKAMNLSPLIEATLVEGGGSEACIQMAQQGIAPVTLSASATTSYDAYNGVGSWKDKPAYKNLRAIMVKAYNATEFVVRADSGIEKLEDLAGKKYSFGLPGGSDYKAAQGALKILGIQVEEFAGSYGDAVEAVKDRRIVGVAKAGIGVQLDAQILQLMAMTPIKILTFTAEQAAKVKAGDPNLTFTTIPAGAINALPQLPAITTLVYGSATAADASVPQSAIYEMLKMWEGHWKDIVIPAYPASAGVNPASAESIEYFAQFNPYPPLHAGAVQFWKEKGHKIPDKLIPPEYKP